MTKISIKSRTKNKQDFIDNGLEKTEVNDKKYKGLTLYFSKEEYEKLKLLSEKNNRSLSNMMKTLLVESVI